MMLSVSVARSQSLEIGGGSEGKVGERGSAGRFRTINSERQGYGCENSEICMTETTWIADGPDWMAE